MELLLMRDDPQADPAARTFGVMTCEELTLQTLERPWVPAADDSPGGANGVSCVPHGVYRLVLHDTEKHPRTWALVNEELGVYHEAEDWRADVAARGEAVAKSARVACLIHSANLVHQLEGCVGVGLDRSLLDGEPDIADSRDAFAALKAKVPWTDGHTLTIIGGSR